MKVKLMSHTPDAEKLVAMAAKLCYSEVGIDELEEGLTEEEIQKFLNRLLDYGHESPIEHASFTFGCEYVSRVTEQHLTRHRIATYSIQSGRFVTRDNATFTIPPRIAANEKALALYLDLIEHSRSAYKEIHGLLVGDIEQELLGRYREINPDEEKFKRKIKYQAKKEANEDARYAFLNSLEVKFMFTMNARSLLNLCRERYCKRAQWEVRGLVGQVIDLIKEPAPTLFKYAGAPCQFGKCPEGGMSCGQPYPRIL